MTWYAHHVFVEAKQQSLDWLLRDPVLASRLYWVRTLERHSWHDVNVKHGLPPNGILVVRPVDDPASGGAEWEKGPAISWHDIRGPEYIQIHITPERVSQECPDAFWGDSPPISFLQYLKYLSSETGSTVAYYWCTTFGGTIEGEYSWVFTPTETVYVCDDCEAHSRPILVWHEDRSVIERNANVLNETLSHFSLHLPTRHFALLERGFPWKDFKVNKP